MTIVNKLTGETFANRKEAKVKMGHANYNRAIKQGNILVWKEDEVTIHDACDIII